MLITRELVAGLNPCSDYTPERLAELIPESGIFVQDAMSGLLDLPFSDACWLLARLLTPPKRVTWAQAAAGRAKGYAQQAKGTSWAAATAATEHELAVRHAVELLSEP